MFRIGEFSKLTQVSIRMLRFYDEAGLLKPAQIDETTGYRLYSVGQIEALQKILLLRDMDFSTAEIRSALEDWSDASVVRRLAQKRLEIEQTIQKLNDRISKIQIAADDVQKGKIDVHYNVSIKAVPGFRVLSLRREIADYFHEGGLWHELSAFVAEHRIPLVQPARTVTVFHDEDHRDTDVDVEVAAEVGPAYELPSAVEPEDMFGNAAADYGNPIGKFKKAAAVGGEPKRGFTCRELEPVPTMACIMVVGPYDRIGSAYRSFAFWLEEHEQFRIAGLVRQISHRGPYDTQNPNEYLTEIQVPIAKRNL